MSRVWVLTQNLSDPDQFEEPQLHRTVLGVYASLEEVADRIRESGLFKDIPGQWEVNGSFRYSYSLPVEFPRNTDLVCLEATPVEVGAPAKDWMI